MWSRLLHEKLEEAGFTRCTTDMCLYFKRSGCDMTIVGVYFDDLLVTASSTALVQEFFLCMGTLSIRICIVDDLNKGYALE